MLFRACLGWATVIIVISSVHYHAAPSAVLATPADAASATVMDHQLAGHVLRSGAALLQQQQQHQEQQISHRSLLQTSRPVVVAHRGASGPLPEHTMPAYLEAIKQGADFIECDVVVTKDLQLVCRHEPNLNDTTNAWELFGHKASTYVIDGKAESGVFAADLTLAEVRQLRAKQRWEFRDHSFNGRFGVVTFEEFIDVALAADRAVGIYPEAKHPSWHNQLPALQAAQTSIEQLMVAVLHSKGYAASAPHASTAWRERPVFIQCFEVTSLQRFAELTPVPLALLLDTAPAPDTGLSTEEVLSDAYLATLAPYVTVMAPWKAMLYTLVGQQGRQPANAAAVEAQGLALPAGAGRALVNATDSNRRLLAAPAAVAPISAAEGGALVAAVGLHHPDIPMSDEAMRQGGQQLQTTGLTARLRKHGFLVHTYTLRDEGQFVLPTCRQGIGCEFDWLFGAERLDGGFADWPGTMHKWLQQQQQGQQKP